MGYKVIITETATKDLSEVVGYIAQDNTRIARRIGFAILARFQLLEKYPFFGRVVPELERKEWRETVYKRWRLIYYVDERRQTIYAARVWHGARGEPELPELTEIGGE